MLLELKVMRLEFHMVDQNQYAPECPLGKTRLELNSRSIDPHFCCGFVDFSDPTKPQGVCQFPQGFPSGLYQETYREYANHIEETLSFRDETSVLPSFPDWARQHYPEMFSRTTD